MFPSGTSELGVDYSGAAATGTLTFGSGSRTAQLDIIPLDDVETG